ncbi:MAG: GMC family oxidoreductase [Gammaproteobacteria bacterium]
MLLDLDDFDADAELDCDVAIVGGGAAGITLARHLAGHGLEVCLAESGGCDFEAATQALAAGPDLGDPYYPLEDSRLRFLGGTTNIWGGRCARFEALDFAPRPWVPGSGWPLELADLEPYYARAAADFALAASAVAADGWRDDSAAKFGLDDGFVTRLWHFDNERERFNLARMDDLRRAGDVRVLLHANLVRIAAAANAASVEALELVSLGGRRARLRARHYVLAAGGIENARLLLASDDVETTGIGNAHDQVGRYFMEHPHGRAGFLGPREGFGLWAAFQRSRDASGAAIAPVLLPSAALQEEAGILNTAFTFKLQRDPALGVGLSKRLYGDLKHGLAPTAGNRRLWHAYRGLRTVVQRSVRRPVERLRHAGGLRRVAVMIRAEQAPNPASRVVLAAARDALGVPRAALDWRLCALDKHTVSAMTARLATLLAARGIGRLEPARWLDEPATSWPLDATVGNHPIGGYHHMGTTRMSASPAHGVVDADCRVHGYANLYVAGSSVFATASWANPTLTIVALAHRLGDHLLARRVR